MRYMIFDPALGFIVKDPERSIQCAYRSRSAAMTALVDGIGHTESETLHTEAYVPMIEMDKLRVTRMRAGDLAFSLEEILEDVDRPSGAVPPGFVKCDRAREALNAWRNI
jgi:hypothetical protein